MRGLLILTVALAVAAPGVAGAQVWRGLSCDTVALDGTTPGAAGNQVWRRYATLVDGGSEELRTGDQAPAFALPGSDGKIHRLADYAGKTVVLAWFPKAFTGG